MRETARQVLDAPGASTLLWVGGQLFDVTAGWHRIGNGSRGRSHRYNRFGQRFDAVERSPSGDLAALISSVGTKSLLLEPDGPVVRELNRSWYHADAYRYPLTLFTMPNGRTGLVHCPTHYNQLEVEDARTGQPVGQRVERAPSDVFHSRLAVSPSGRYLLSAGWLWQPCGCLVVYDLTAALDDPSTLDRFGVFALRGLIQAEVAGAAFVGDDIIIISNPPETNDAEEPDDLGPNMLARWSLTAGCVWRRELDACVGDLLPMAGGVLSLDGHPRWHDPATGQVAWEWPDRPTGAAQSSIAWADTFTGRARVAVDESGRRLAHTDGEKVTVVGWDPA